MISSTLHSLLTISIILTFTYFSDSIQGLGLLEPNDGQVYLAAWVDTAQPFYDTPAAFNQRIGHNAAAFQFSQTIPLTPYSYVTGAGGAINETLVELSGTSAAIFLTVYPTSLSGIADSDLQALANQILSYQSSPLNRDVYLRYGPEMQGNWMPYGGQPSAYVTQWKRMHDVIRATAPKTVLVWAPNGAMGYPYGETLATITATADQTILDTNHNGVLDMADDAYAPYYPGDNYVDWNGISWYWKGTQYPYTVNQVQPAGYSEGAMSGTSPAGAIGTGPAQNFTNFYGTYCQNKPCMFAEMGAAFHSNTTTGAGPGQLAMQTAWWQDTLTSKSFQDTYPKVKMYMLFEHLKAEDGNDLRDYRLTNDTTVRTNFLNDLSAVSSRYVWATNRAIPTSQGKTSTGSSSAFPSQSKRPSIFSKGSRVQAPAWIGLQSLMLLSVWWLVC